MTKEQIERINELARTSRERALKRPLRKREPS